MTKRASTDFRLDAALLRAVREAWHGFNHARFHQSLRPPVFALHAGRSDLGRWTPRTRTISLSRPLVHEAPWAEVEAVLLHEMAHQFVSEVLRRDDEPPHGPAFRWVYSSFRLEAALARPLAEEAAPEPKVLRRVRALLALSSSPNEHEAQAALAAAHRLLLKHNLSEDAVRGEARTYGYRRLRPVQLRVPLSDKILATILVSHFFVEGIWVQEFDRKRLKWGTCFEIMGTRANLEVAEWVWGTVRETAERLWQRARVERGLTGRERRAFLVGVMTGFHDRLEEQARTCRAEEGLVWVGDAALEDWSHDRYPRRRSTGSSAPVRGLRGYRAGEEAGRKLELRRPLRGDGAKTAGPAGFLEG